MTISYIIPSLNRPSLHRTIASIDAWLNDEIIVEFDIPKMNMWGNPQRNKGMLRAKGDYLAFIDDDDMYVKNHRELMEDAIHENPGVPILFRMQYPNGDVLWKDRLFIPGNIGSPMILIPNKPEMLHIWEGGRNMADFIFIDKCKWPKEKIVWRKEVIALLGHDGANYKK